MCFGVVFPEICECLQPFLALPEEKLPPIKLDELFYKFEFRACVDELPPFKLIVALTGP